MTSARLMVAIGVLTGSMVLTEAQEPPTPSAEPQARRDSLTVTVGDVLTRVDGPKRWTLSGVDYQGKTLSVQESAYGSVLNIKGVGILGSAHFLDVPGKPGQVEKESVSELRFFVDDKPLESIAPRMTVAGKSFRMERESEIRSVHLTSTVTLKDDVLIESARMRSRQPVELKVSYPLMQAWSPRMTHHLFGDANGIQKRGAFLAGSSKPGEGVEKTATWMAVYSTQEQVGAVVCLLQRPAEADAWLQYTDAPGIYRKLRLMSFVEKTMPAGFDGTFQWAVTGFAASPEDWEARATGRWRHLQSLKTAK